MKPEYRNAMGTPPMPLSQFLSFSLAICDALDELHRKDKIHTDIRPENIYWKPENSEVELICAAEGVKASLFSKVRLPYISPEQTGRMAHRIDHRTDLYSLGVVFYELLTGKPPFLAEDPLEVIHSHIAKIPAPAHERNAEIPEQISAVVNLLLEKNAEDRYQTALGLRHDLNRCSEQLDTNGGIEKFELGTLDHSGIFSIPQKLYGREKEVTALLETFDRVSVDSKEILMVAGYSGVGKTALVHEVQKYIDAKRSYFLEGKFDQFQRNVPYFAWGQAFGGFVSQLLMESEVQLNHWKTQILEAVGLNGKLLTDVIPQLLLVIGSQPDVPKLDGQATQNRFNYVFQSFIKLIARKEHPLVIFLDDLQWIDIASLNFLESLVSDPDLTNILIIGAYRDSEMDAAHPLMMSMAELQDANIKLECMTLEPLLESDVNALCSETLQCSQSESQPLAQLIYTKTHGNAFFTRQMIHSLNEESLLTFDISSEKWQWDLDTLKKLDIADNVIDLLIAKVRKLPVATQHMLQLAACIGNQFDISALTMLAQQPAEAVNPVLEVCLTENILLPVDSVYKFAHDRIQQAVYSLIPPDAREHMHRRIGFSLLDNTPADELDGKVFDVAGHLNQALDVIDKDKDRILISKLNLKAGQKAKSSAAYSDAKRYIEIGLDLLGPNSWQDHYALTLALNNENGELASLTGQFDEVSFTANLIQANAKNILDQVRVYMTRIEAETRQYNLTQALEIGMKVLKELGMEVRAQPEAGERHHLQDRIVDMLADRSEECWAELPEMSDQTALAKSYILASEVSTSFTADPPLFPIITYQGVVLTLQFGLNVWSPFFFASAAMLMVAQIDHETPASVAFEKIRLIKILQSIAVAMMENLVTAPSRTRTLALLATAAPWVEPIDKSIRLTQATVRSGFDGGDFLYGPYGASHFAKQSFAAGVNLGVYQSQLSDYTSSLRRIGQEVVPQFLSIYLQTAQNFKETCPHPNRLTGTYFNEDEWLPVAIAKKNFVGRNILAINKLVLSYYFDIDDRLAECVREVKELLASDQGTFTIPQFYLYTSLAMLRLMAESSTNDHTETMSLVESYHQWTGIWSQSVPATFQHKYDLIVAEMARVKGDLGAALSAYEQAIDGAQANGFIHEEALANELYGRFWMERDNVRLAGPLLAEAHSLYRKWGGEAKAEQLIRRYPECMAKVPVPTTDAVDATAERMADKLDLHTILKASQKIAGEIELESLLTNMMDIAIENAGAQKGFLVMEEEGQWMVVAGGDIESVDKSGVVSQRIVNYVIRTQESIVLVDAANEGDFSNDPIIQHGQSKSILCTPLINQGQTSGILYLENNLATGAFTLERVELLNLLSSQMAMALDNVKLYSKLNAKIAEVIEREKRFRGTFEQAAVGIAHVSTEGKFIRINQKFCDIVGYSKDDMLDLSFQRLTHPDDLETDLEHVRQMLKGEIKNYSLEKRYYRKDGSLIWVNLTVSLMLDDSGEPSYFVSVITDITQSKTMAERLRAMTSELIFTEEKERQRIATELHDGPAQSLALALLQLEEASEAVVGSTPEIMVDAASQQIHQSLRQIRGVLLDLSSPTLHRMGLSAGLSDWLEENIRDKHGLKTVFRDECGDVVLAQEVRLLLFRNVCELLKNVVKHAQAQRVYVSMACGKQSLQIVVEDDGVGFDPDAADKLPGQSGGFGLFSIAVRMVDLGGSLDIVSAPGKGCKATLTAPLEPVEKGVSQ